MKDDDARQLVRQFLARSPSGGWLPPDAAGDLLACFGIPLASHTPAACADGAGHAGRRGRGDETVIGVTQEPVFGPLVMVGPGDAAPGAAAGQAARLAPLTDTDAEELISSIRPAPWPRCSRDAPPAGLAALRETLLRVSRLADDLPEVAELELSPVIARAAGVHTDGARIRLTPSEAHDPFLRKLL